MPGYMSGIEVNRFYGFLTDARPCGFQHLKRTDDALQTIVGIFSSNTDADDSLERVLLSFLLNGFAAFGGSLLHISK